MPCEDVTALLGEREGYRVVFVQRHEADPTQRFARQLRDKICGTLCHGEYPLHTSLPGHRHILRG